MKIRVILNQFLIAIIVIAALIGLFVGRETSKELTKVVFAAIIGIITLIIWSRKKEIKPMIKVRNPRVGE